MPKGSSMRNIQEIEAMDLRDKRRWDRLKKYESYIYALEKGTGFLSRREKSYSIACLKE